MRIFGIEVPFNGDTEGRAYLIGVVGKNGYNYLKLATGIAL